MSQRSTRTRSLSASTVASTRKRTRTVAKQPSKVKLGKQPFPKQLYNTVVYAERVTLTCDGSGRASFSFNANSLYDPNASGTGHQPLYFDQLTTIYDHYTVLKSTIRVAFNSDASSTAANGISFGVIVDDDATPPTSNFSSFAERRMGSWQTFQYPGSQPKDIYYTADMKAIHGSVIGNDNLQGSATASPVEITSFIVWVDAGVNANSHSIIMDVCITYDCMWDEFTSIAQS